MGTCYQDQGTWFMGDLLPGHWVVGDMVKSVPVCGLLITLVTAVLGTCYTGAFVVGYMLRGHLGCGSHVDRIQVLEQHVPGQHILPNPGSHIPGK